MKNNEENIQFFYLRVKRYDGPSSNRRISCHRVGAMAIEKTDLGYKVAATLCSDRDTFSAKYARNATMGRLKKSDVYINGDESLEQILCRFFEKALFSYNFVHVIYESRNKQCVKKAIDTLQERAGRNQ
jgi:hypothetical protein